MFLLLKNAVIRNLHFDPSHVFTEKRRHNPSERPAGTLYIRYGHTIMLSRLTAFHRLIDMDPGIIAIAVL